MNRIFTKFPHLPFSFYTVNNAIFRGIFLLACSSLYQYFLPKISAHSLLLHLWAVHMDSCLCMGESDKLLQTSTSVLSRVRTIWRKNLCVQLAQFSIWSRVFLFSWSFISLWSLMRLFNPKCKKKKKKEKILLSFSLPFIIVPVTLWIILLGK